MTAEFEKMEVRFTDEHQTRRVRWMQSVASTDKTRYALNGIYLTGDRMIASDGISIAMCPRPEPLCNGRLDNKVVIFARKLIRVKPQVETLEITDYSFPDADELFHDARLMSRTKNLQFRVGVSMSVIKSLSQMPYDKFIIDFRSPRQPFYIYPEQPDENDHKFLVMPFALSEDRKLYERS